MQAVTERNICAKYVTKNLVELLYDYNNNNVVCVNNINMESV